MLGQRNNRRLRPVDRSRRSISVRVILWFGLAAILLWMSTLARWSRSMVVTKTDPITGSNNNPLRLQQQQLKVMDENNDPEELEESTTTSIGIADLWPEDYSSKDIYDSLQVCNFNNKENKSRKCPQPVTPSSPRQYIGLLYPPGALSYMFTQFIKDVVRLHAMPETDLELVPTTTLFINNHSNNPNFTKIIRFAILPLLLSASDTVMSTLDKSSLSMATIQLDDLMTAARQLFRWHCHLSKLAEHSIPTMTMTLADLVENPWDAELNVRNFLDLEPHDPNNNNNNEWSEKHVDEDEMMASLEEMINYCIKLFEQLEKTSTAKNIKHVFREVIQDEIQHSHTTSTIACKSAKELEKNGVVGQTLAVFLSSDNSQQQQIAQDALCKVRSSAPICRDRETPMSSKSLQAKNGANAS